MEPQENPKGEFEELSKLYMFGELYKFFKESTGIAMTAAYLALILSSMAYLHVLYSAFDISIVKYVTFEDILATPIKNPDIIIIFCVIISILYATDKGNRFRARQQIKYANQEKPFGFKIIQMILWSPKKRQANFKTTAFIVACCLSAYIYFFASSEASKIKDSEGTLVEISLANNTKVKKSALLGTTINYVFTYNIESNESVVYAIESVESMKKYTEPTPAKPIAPVSSASETPKPVNEQPVEN